MEKFDGLHCPDFVQIPTVIFDEIAPYLAEDRGVAGLAQVWVLLWMACRTYGFHQWNEFPADGLALHLGLPDDLVRDSLEALCELNLAKCNRQVETPGGTFDMFRLNIQKSRTGNAA